MKKIVVIFICICLIVICFAGCSDMRSGKNNKYAQFKEIYSGSSDWVYVDTTTGVIYYWINDGVTPLYNADGTLKNISDFE